MDFALSDFYTIDYIYQLPDGERAELIDGHIYYMAPPNSSHQHLVSELVYQINDYIKKNNGTCKVFPAPFAVFLNEDDKTYVEPDVCVICDNNKINEKGCMGAPDWIIEIVSPSSIKMDYMIKLFKYKNAGVKEYWIIDKLKDRITVYDFEHNELNEYSCSDCVKTKVYDGLIITFSEI